MDNELSRVVDALPVLVWTALPDGRADFLNQRWLEYTGLNYEVALGRGWDSILHPDDLPTLLVQWSNIIASGQPGTLEARMRRFDGVYRWFQVRASPMHDAAGGIIKWCGVNTDIEEQKQAEDALRAVEGRYRSIVDGLPAIVTLLDTDGHVTHANRYMLEYLGTKHDEMKARDVGQAFHPEDRPDVLARWEQSVKTGQPYDFEARLRRADGIYRWFHTIGFPLRNPQGQIDLWYFLQTDVHDRRCADELLAGEKRFLELAMSGATMSQVLDDLCLLAEATFTRSFCTVGLVDQGGNRFEHAAAPSLPPNFISGMVDHPISDQSSPCATALHLDEKVFASDLESGGNHGTYAWAPEALAQGLLGCWATPITSTTGKVLGAMAIYYDYTRSPSALHHSLIEQFKHIASVAIEKLQSDDALRRSEALLKEGQHLSSTGTFLWDVATHKITWSDELYRIFEIDPSVPISLELIGSRFHSEDIPMMREMVDRAERDDGDLEYEFRLRTPGGSIKYIQMVAHRSGEQGSRIEYIGALQNITERRVSEDALDKVRSELVHVARMTSLGALAASIVHEVSQPVSGIITNAGTCVEMLASVPPDVDGGLETAHRIVRDGDRASEVITRLRALFIKKPTRKELIDINEATREVLALTLNELQRGRVSLRTELQDGLPPILGDRVQLQQVMMNLFMNAADAMSSVEDRTRHLLIKTGQEGGDRVRLTVQDAGVGFESDDLERIFEAFYTTKTTGMGIGLAVSRSIVERHSGRLWASANEGPGVTFSFSIPHQPSSPAISPHHV